jgi:hypothetical protein
VKTNEEALQKLKELEIEIRLSEAVGNVQRVKLLAMFVAGINWAFDFTQQPASEGE